MKREITMVATPSGILVPDHIATEAGMGCPLCDDHELVPLRPEWELVPIITKFRERHRGHGSLEAIEKRGDRLYVTHKIPGLT